MGERRNAVLGDQNGDHKRNKKRVIHIKAGHKSGGHLGVYRRQGVYRKAERVRNRLYRPELREATPNRVEVTGKAYDETTKRRVAVWKAAERKEK